MAQLIAFQGTITTTGTAQQLTANPVVNGVVIAAKSGNTAAIEVGNAGVTTSTGFILAAGASTPVIEVLNTNAIYLVGTSGDTFSVIGS